jgi:hypothetical protein
VSLLAAMVGAAAWAAPLVDRDPTRLDLTGDFKSFGVALLPYENSLLMPDDPQASASWDLRLKLEGRTVVGPVELALTAHQATTAIAPPGDPRAGSGSTGVGGTAPQLVDLDADLIGGDDLSLRTRTDRLSIAATVPHLRLTLGRQPITFGRALLFTPLDLVNPFQPTVIDSEYKPGVDAARLDGFWGTATQLTLVTAWAGEASAAGIVAAFYGSQPVGSWDLGLLLGDFRGDAVGGLSLSGGLGPVAVRAEGSGTLPNRLGDENVAGDAYVRAVLGGDWMATPTLSLSAEVYHQGNGAGDPSDYLQQAVDPRYARGELWLLGRWYAGAGLSWQTAPRLAMSAFSLVNLADGSTMLGPGLSWSVADEASLTAGAWIGLGERPGEVSEADLLAAAMAGEDPLGLIPVATEFGMAPTAVNVALKVYF